LELNNRNNSNTIEQLSSGKKINHSADDPSGTAISSTMKKDMISIRQAARNALEASSFFQLMDGTLSVISEKIIRLKELSLQVANDTFSDNERKLVDRETRELLDEMDAIVASSKYNDIRLLDGTSPPIEFLVGLHSDNNGKLIVNLPDYNCSIGNLGLDKMNNLSKIAAQNNIAVLNNAIEKISGKRALLGAMQSSIDKIRNQLVNSADGIEGSKSQIVDADFANKTAELVKGRITAKINGESLIRSNLKHGLALKLIR